VTVPAGTPSDRAAQPPERGATRQPAEGAATRPPAALSAAAFVSSLDRFAVSPLLVVIAADLGVTLAQTVAIASGYFLAYGLLQPVWGIVSDRYGRVRLLRGALLGAAAAAVASAFAPTLGALVAARLVTGGLFGASSPPP
jgi:MFS family permease